VTDVAEPFAMSLAAVSKHVRMLERAGLVRRARRGREHTLTLDARPLRQVVRWTSPYERFWTERLDRLEAYVAQKGRTMADSFDSIAVARSSTRGFRKQRAAWSRS
jgi:DNA-binding transcriptional ArsR family regulator